MRVFGVTSPIVTGGASTYRSSADECLRDPGGSRDSRTCVIYPNESPLGSGVVLRMSFGCLLLCIFVDHARAVTSMC